MTREEEIKKAAVSFCRVEEAPNGFAFISQSSFVVGALWADRTMIEKACKWLKDYAHIYVSETTGDLNEDELINAFRKDMKGE